MALRPTGGTGWGNNGLMPSHDDTLSGMLLAAWYYGALDARSGRPFFACSDNLQLVTTAVSVSYLRYAAQGYFASPLLHFVHALSCPKRTAVAIDSLLRAYVRGRYTAGVLAWSTIITRKTMKTLVVALGGNALLQRGEALTAENQYRNIASAVPALARRLIGWRSFTATAAGGVAALAESGVERGRPVSAGCAGGGKPGDDWRYAGRRV